MSDMYGMKMPSVNAHDRYEIRWFSPNENIALNARIEFADPVTGQLYFHFPLSELRQFMEVLKLMDRNALDTELRIKNLDGRGPVE